MDENENFIQNVWMSDEAHFHLDGFVNKQNFRYWSEENPRQLYQRPLHSDKVTVWCAISHYGIIGPYFHEDENGRATTVNSNRYVNMINNFLAGELTKFPQNDNFWFQQDGATSHTARVSINAIQQIFGNRIISKNGDIHWPPRSPDLSVCDFFLWGYLKSKVYAQKPRNIDELKNKIKEEIASIPLDVIHRVVENIRNRLEECSRRDGHHLEDIIFKK